MKILIHSARENNLNNLDLNLPLGQFTVVCGPSGAGKTSLIVNTLFAESQRRFIETVGTRRRGKFSLWKRPEVESIENLPPAVTVSEKAGANQTLASLTGMDDVLALEFSRSSIALCPSCQTLYRARNAESTLELISQQYSLCKAQIAFSPILTNAAQKSLPLLVQQYVQRGYTRWLKEDPDGEVELLDYRQALSLPPDALNSLYVLADRVVFKPEESRAGESAAVSIAESGGKTAVFFIETPEGNIKRYVGNGVCCPNCGRILPSPFAERFYLEELPQEGTPQRQEILAYRLDNRNLLEWLALSADEIAGKYPFAQRRCQAISDAGLGYMPLSRTAGSMSCGQIKRAGMASMFAGDLINMLYIFDEPTDGLPVENRPALLKAILDLKNRGNTVVIAENDPSFIRAADKVIRMEKGDLMAGWELESEDGAGKKRPLPLVDDGSLLTAHSKVSAVCGPAGSGKTTLVFRKLYPALLERWGRTIPPDIDRIPYVLPNEIAFSDCMALRHEALRKPVRGCIATYLKIWDRIRDELASTAEAAARGFTPGDFSLLTGEGRCPECKGEGVLKINLEYLPEIETVCGECQGERFRPEYLQIRYRGLNPAEILRLTVQDAFVFFRNVRKVQFCLKSLIDMGLDYLALGQSMEALSSGELNRVNFAAAISAIRKEKTLFLLDEPSAGLDDSQLHYLWDCFNRLTAYGHTIIMIENNLRMIEESDCIIRL